MSKHYDAPDPADDATQQQEREWAEATAAACPSDAATCALCADAAGRPCQTLPTAPAKGVNMWPEPF